MSDHVKVELSDIAASGKFVTINAQQAEALAALLWEGKGVGDDIDPVRVVALVAIGQTEAIGTGDMKRDRKTGEYVTDPDKPDQIAIDDPMPPSHTIVAVAMDGRAWSLVRAGICWPIEEPTDD